MALNIKTKISFCGKDRKFKRTLNKELKDNQKEIEAIQDKMQPLIERNRDYQFKVTELEDEIESIDKHLLLLDKLDEPTDEEIRESIKLNREKTGLQKEIHELRRENDSLSDEDKKFFEDLDQELRDTYATFAVKVLDGFEFEEFEENADSTDLTIAPRLSELYRLALSGASQKEMDKAYKQIIKDSFQ